MPFEVGPWSSHGVTQLGKTFFMPSSVFIWFCVRHSTYYSFINWNQVCGRDFTRKYHLDRHKMFSKCGSGKNKSELTCRVCSRVFTRIDNLREHLRGHMGQPTRRKDYQCPYCDKSFYGSSLLNIHIRTHTGEKPFLWVNRISKRKRKFSPQISDAIYVKNRFLQMGLCESIEECTPERNHTHVLL